MNRTIQAFGPGDLDRLGQCYQQVLRELGEETSPAIQFRVARLILELGADPRIETTAIKKKALEVARRQMLVVARHALTSSDGPKRTTA